MAQSDTTPRSRVCRPLQESLGGDRGRGGSLKRGEGDEKRKKKKKNTVDLRVRLNQPNYFVQSTREGGGAATV